LGKKRLSGLSKKLKSRLFRWKKELDPASNVEEHDLQASSQDNDETSLGRTIVINRLPNDALNGTRDDTSADVEQLSEHADAEEDEQEASNPEIVVDTNVSDPEIVVDTKVSDPVSEFNESPCVESRRQHIEKLFDRGHGFGVASPSFIQERRSKIHQNSFYEVITVCRP
jgi:hypothetical protein